MSVNKVILIGNIGQDPDLRKLPNGDSVCNVSLATSKKWKDKTTGETKEKTEWHRVVFFGRTADAVAQYCPKGSTIYVEGELETRTWEKDGVKQYTTEIRANLMDIQKTPNGPQSGGQQSQNSSQQRTQQQSRPAQQQPQQNFDDDVPF